ncbi:serine carboxypeptidase-like 40 [Tripterygium wilfordii]|uniref:serine carboxypeptidase-like 40 n=1 Tax=Tripterygium wilfordii TaxID=458696 RepID=UPI0018F84050|nr:serine carboxypeptidase-like 40 [Tripterygium wilfordii]
MENKPSSLLQLWLLTISVSLFMNTIQCKRHQGQALSNLYKWKMNPDSGIDTSIFDAKHNIINKAKFQSQSQEGLKEKDRIDRLPGQPIVDFAHYGGYVTVDRSAGRALYYYFVEAAPPLSSDSLPLLLWLNGGPGCSSLAYGAMQELGPFRVHSDGKTLYRNRYSWNNAANVLFLESPAGVGFSYSNRTSDYTELAGDRSTAADNYVFLLNWLERFPEYKGRDFYISGESYAGHYVPQLAHTILHHNKISNKTIINLKGIMIGNAVINQETDDRGMYDYFETHALISDDTGYQIRKTCNFSPEAVEQSSQCYQALDEAAKNVGFINIYNIYAPGCFNESITAKPKPGSIINFDPCSDFYVYAYINCPEVQAAMHANVTKLIHDWEPCSDILGDWKDSPSTVLPVLKELMENKLRLWVFSGDTDGRVPVTSTKYSIKKMKLDVKTSWHPWFIAGEVGGYTQVYEGGLTFATVRGAGHQVPSYQPIRALSLIKHFLDGTPLPNTSKYA